MVVYYCMLFIFQVDVSDEMQPESKKQDEAEKKQYDVSHSHDTMGETLVCGICQVL